MRAITTLALAVTLATLASAYPKSHQLDGYTFEQWAAEAGRQYSSEDEVSRRKTIFNQQLAEIKKHNADKSQTYRKGVNQFSDWTSEEWKRYNAYKPTKLPLIPSSVTTTEWTWSGNSSTIDEKVYRASGVPVPRTVDYRFANPPVLTSVKNQGACGSCWAHSATESIESHFAIQFDQLPVLSQQQITSCTRTEQGCGGGAMNFGFKYVMESQGLYEEWTYPYTDFFSPAESLEGTAPCKNISKEYLPNFSWLPKANVTQVWIVESNNATATMEALAMRGPLSISVGASEWQSYEGGIYTNADGTDSSAPWEIDHGVQLVGYGHDTDMDMDYWVVRNSWGTTWGEAGFIRLSRPKVEPCGSTFFGPTACGTSGLLNGPSFPETAMLAKLN